MHDSPRKDSSPQTDKKSEKRPFLRAAGLVGAITLVSRFLGLARDVVLGACLGASRMGDVFWAAFELPNLARRVLGEGSLSAFIVPIFTKVRGEKGEAAAWRFASNALTVMGAATLVLSALGILAARPLFSLYGYGYFERGDLEAIALGTRLTRIMFPFLMLLATSSILMGLCHAARHFTTPALGSIMLNVTMIGVGLVFWRDLKSDRLSGPAFAHWLAVAVLAGALLRLLIMIPPLVRAGMRYRAVFDPRSEAMRRLFGMMLPAMFGLAVVQINISVSRAFATILGEGFLTSLVYSNRLVQLPLAVVASALATAILPQLSQMTVEGREDDLRELVRFAFRLIFILFVPATVGLMVLGHPVVQLLFERGKWDPLATLWTYQALLFYAPGLALWGLLRILTPIYYARHDVRTPVLVATAAMVVSVTFNVLLLTVGPLRATLGHGGLALANTLGVLVNAILLLCILHRRGLALWEPGLTLTAVRTLQAGAAMGIAAWAMWEFGGNRAVEAGQLWGFAALAATIALSAGVYFALAFALRVPDLGEALRIVARREGR